MPLLRSLSSECSNNINIIKRLEYFPLGVTHHQVIQPHIVDLVVLEKEKSIRAEKIETKH